MTELNQKIGVSDALSRNIKLKKRIGTLVAWPLACVLLAIILWGFTLGKISADQAKAETEAQAAAVSLSKSYSEQLARTLKQIDSLSLNLRYDWERYRTGLDLQDQMRGGLYPPTSDLYLSIVNNDGDVVASTLEKGPANVADRPFFQFHRSHPQDVLHVDASLYPGQPSARRVVRFTRRLNLPDGTFDGIVSVNVEPAFLATFTDESGLKPHDFISIRHDDGALLVSEKGQEIRGGQVHLQPPVFPSPSGVMRVPAEKFRDNEARILAWNRLRGYPLVSYVGLAEADQFRGHVETAESYRRIAVAASFFLGFVGVMGMVFSSRLASRRRQAEEIKNTYHLAINDAREGFYMVRAIYGDDGVVEDFVIEDCNERGASMFARAKKTLIGSRLSALDISTEPARCMSVYQHAMTVGFNVDEFEFANPQPEQPHWVHRRLVRSDVGLAVTLRDISDTKENEQILVSMANTDTLTGLPNRHWMINFLPTALLQAEDKNAILAVFFIDLDNFKNVNDTLGHAVGDEVLRLAAERLKLVMRADDHVIRLGGDEFTVLMTSVADTAKVVEVATRIAASFRDPIAIQGREIYIGTSIGISLFPQDGVEPDTLIQKADIAMYAAKAEGKGRFAFYDHRLYEAIRQRLDAESELERGIEEKQFEMYYQPRVNVFTGKITGLEALVRWNHPQRGMVPPSEFIPLAEKNGCIIPLGKLVIDQVCQQIAQWRDLGEPLVPISVNISPRQLDAGGIDTLIVELLQTYAIDAELIEIELTESAMMSESPDVLRQVAAISRLGIKMHLDDFGTGYSSLSRLQEINMNVIKIDQAFTSRLGVGKESEILFETIVQMAKALKMGVIAEGVETEEQLQILQRLSCDEAQGYLISRPLPAAQIPDLVRRLSGDDRDKSAPHGLPV